MKFTLIIPAHNEAPVITPTLRLLSDALARESDLEWTIIVADNASTDGTGDAALRFADEHVKVFAIAEQGKGNAVRLAFAQAEGDVVGFIDADLPVSPEEVLAATELIAGDNADIVVGSRLLPHSTLPGREWWRTGSSRLFNALARTIVGIHASDAQCPLKVMNAKGVQVMLATKEPTWFFDLEFRALAERLGLRIAEVPVAWNEHRYPERKSKLTVLDSFRAIAAMFRIRARIPAQLTLLRAVKR